MLDLDSLSSSWGSDSVEAPIYASTIKLCVPGSKDSPEYYSLNVDQRLMGEYGPSIESLMDWVARCLDVRESQTLSLQYLDMEGDVVILPRGDDEAFALALMQFPRKSLKITAVLNQANESVKTPDCSVDADAFSHMERAPTLIKLIVENEGDGNTRRCRRVSFSRILTWGPGTEARPSLGKLKELGAELADKTKEEIELACMGKDGDWRFLEKDSHILDSMHHAFLQMQGDCARSDEDLSWVLKVYVNEKARPEIRLKYKDQALVFDSTDLYDKTKHTFCYERLLDKFSALCKSPCQALLFYHSETKKLPFRIRNDQELQIFIERHHKNPNLSIIGQVLSSVLTRFLTLAGMIAMFFAFASHHFAVSPKASYDGTSYAHHNETHECPRDEGIRQVHLSPLNATILGRYAHVRTNPHPHVLFYHKTNRAMWELPNSDLVPGRYLVSAHVSRKSGSTSLHLGATSADDLTAFDYREMFMNVNQVNPTGSWSKFSQMYLGEVSLSGKDDEKFVVVADGKSPNVDFQGISLVHVGPVPRVV